MGRYVQMDYQILSRLIKLFFVPVLGMLIGIAPKLFIDSFDSIFNIYGTHLSLGNWLVFLIFIITIFYDFVLSLYLLKTFKADKILPSIAILFLVLEWFLASRWL